MCYYINTMTMNISASKKDKIEHERLVKLIEKAKEEADKFVKKNAEIEKRLQISRTALYS